MVAVSAEIHSQSPHLTLKILLSTVYHRIIFDPFFFLPAPGDENERLKMNENHSMS